MVESGLVSGSRPRRRTWWIRRDCDSEQFWKDKIWVTADSPGSRDQQYGDALRDPITQEYTGLSWIVRRSQCRRYDEFNGVAYHVMPG